MENDQRGFYGIRLEKNIFENGLAELLNFFIGKNILEGYELGHFWYLYALVGIYTLFPLLKICNETQKGHVVIKYMMVIVFIFTFGVSTLNFFMQLICFYTNRATGFSWSWITSYYILGNYGYCLFWFLLGGVFYPKVAELRAGGMVTKKLNISFLMFGIGWLLLFLMNRFQNKVGEAVGIVIDGYECIPTCLMCVALFTGTGLALYEKTNRIIIYISKNTWGIYMLHLLVGTAFLVVQSNFHFSCGVFLNFMKSIWMMSASLLTISIWKRIPLLRRLLTF